MKKQSDKTSLLDKMSESVRPKKMVVARIDKDLHEKVMHAMHKEGNTWVQLVESACALYLGEVEARGTSKGSK